MEGKLRWSGQLVNFARNQRKRTPKEVAVLIVLILCTLLFLIAYNGSIRPDRKWTPGPQYRFQAEETGSVSNIIETRPLIETTFKSQLSYVLGVFNKLGEAGSISDLHSRTNVESIVKSAFQPLPHANISHEARQFYLDEEVKLLSIYEQVFKLIPEKSNFTRAAITKTGVTINLAAVACGESRVQEIKTMLKSAVVFSQDSHLHIIMFSEEESMVAAGEMLLQLRWETNAAGWDFTFEVHQDWFPSELWKGMYAKCATQRLFLPHVLKHVDSVVLVDSDALVVSNLTDMWNLIPREMGSGRLAGMTPNTENSVVGWYGGGYSKVPFYIPSGVNAGVMLMNLTQMREFDIVNRSLAAYTLYHEKMFLADQDIYNIIFNAHPEKMYLMDCSYNFHWYHCKPNIIQCINEKGEHMCFCRAVGRDGLKILHGLGGMFHNDLFHFIKDPAEYFRKFNLVTDSPFEMFRNLRIEFKQKDNGTLCGPLTAKMMYDNAETFLAKIYSKEYVREEKLNIITGTGGRTSTSSTATVK